MMNDYQIDMLHKLQMKIAGEIKRICVRHNIQFFLDAGTMLGAVRHKGFIPWDDDMDIGMLYEDYDRFLLFAENELGEDYYIDYYPKNQMNGRVFAKVRLKNTLFVEKYSNVANKHHEIFVDVFPYFYRPNNKFIKFTQDVRLIFYSQVFMAKSGLEYYKHRHGLGRIKYIPILFASNFGSSKFWYNKIISISRKCKKSCLVGALVGIRYRDWCYSKSFLNNIIWVEFENELFPIPEEYDKILRIYYGNYMELPPIEKRRTHGAIKVDFGPYEE